MLLGPFTGDVISQCHGITDLLLLTYDQFHNATGGREAGAWESGQ